MKILEEEFFMDNKFVAPLVESLRKVNYMDVEISMRKVKDYTEKDLNITNQFAVLYLAHLYATLESFEDVMAYIQENIADDLTKEKLFKTLNKFYKTVEDLSRSYKRKELKKALQDWNVSTDNEMTDESWNSIYELSEKLLDVQESDVFLNWNAGDYKMGVKVLANHEKISVYGIDDSADSKFLGDIRSAIFDNKINVIADDVTKKDFSNLQATKIFCNLKVGNVDDKNLENAPLEEFFKDIRGRICKEWLYPIAAMLNQKIGGRTVAVILNNNLSNEADKNIRKKLIEEGKVEGIIALIGNLNLIILSDNNKSVKMLDATKISNREVSREYGRKVFTSENVTEILSQYSSEEGENFITVTNENIRCKNYVLYPSRYLVEEKITFDKFKFMTECAKYISRGNQMIRPSDLEKMKSDTPTCYQYMAIQDITEYGLRENLPYIKIIGVEYKGNFLEAGDIVISKLAPFKVAVIPETENKILAGGNVYCIKTCDDVNPYYLALFLKSEQGVMQLNALAGGGNHQIISLRDLERVKIPMIPLDEQNKIAEKYLSLVGEIKSLQKKIESFTDEIKTLL